MTQSRPAASRIDNGPAPMPPGAFNLAAHVLAGGRHAPERVALAIVSPTGAERWSHAALARAVLGTAGALLSRGLQPGQRVLLRLGNSVDFPIAFLAAAAVDLLPVPVSAQLTGTELERVIEMVRPACILADPRLPMPDRGADGSVIDLATLRGMRSHPPADFRLGDPDRPGYVILTSGTSSARPRAVLHAHRAIFARRMMDAGWTGIGPGDRVMHAGAFNWTYTLGTGLLDPWVHGATALIPAEGTPVEALPLLMKRFDATIFAAVPGIYRRLLRVGLPPLPRLRHGLSAGEALPPALRRQWREATGTDLHEALGMTECSTFVSGAPDRPAPEGTTGHPQPGRHVAVLGADGAPVPRGTPGTLAVHRSDPGLMLGYLDDPAATEERFRGDWFVTGDEVVMSDDGAIRYLGRSDDMLNAGGFRVSPLEVEEAAMRLPGVVAAAAFEVEVREGVRVIALAYVGDGVDEAVLRHHLEARLARYKQPRLLIRRDGLPLAANGKVARRVLRTEWEREREQ